MNKLADERAATKELDELWEHAFIAALTGAAASADGWHDGRTTLILNRAYRLADEAVEQIAARRAAPGFMLVSVWASDDQVLDCLMNPLEIVTAVVGSTGVFVRLAGEKNALRLFSCTGDEFARFVEQAMRERGFPK